MKKVWVIFLMMIVLLCGCSSSKESADMAVTEENRATYGYAKETMEELGMESAEYAEEGEYEAAEMDAVEDTGENVPESGSKIIRTVDLYMETLEFEELTQLISSKAAEYDGYVESSSISNNSYYSNATRYGYFLVRIPAEKADAFMESLGDAGTVVSQSENLEDVTLQYVDMESHIQVLETEREHLLELMEQAETVEEILQIEERLTDIRYEMEAYQSKLNVLDHKINYTTISIDVDEVQQITTPEEASLWKKIADGFVDSLHGIGSGMESLIVFVLSRIPYIALAAVVILVLIVIVKKRKNSK